MNTPAAYTIDSSKDPVIRFEWHRNATAEEFQQYLAALTQIVESKRRVTLLFQLPAVLSFKTEERLTMSRWLRDHETQISRFVLGTCFVTPSPLVTMALRAIFIFAPPKNAWKVTGSLAEAEAWCRSAQVAHTTHLAS